MTDLSLSASSDVCLPSFLPSDFAASRRERERETWTTTTTTTSISRIVIIRASAASFFLFRSSSCFTLPCYSAERARGTRNYESVHDRTNRLPRRIGPLRILISIVIKFFVATRACERTLLLKRQWWPARLASHHQLDSSRMLHMKSYTFCNMRGRRPRYLIILPSCANFYFYYLYFMSCLVRLRKFWYPIRKFIRI